MAWYQSRFDLAEAIKGAVVKFPSKAGHEDEDSDAKVIQLSYIVVEPKKQADKLQDK